VTLSFNGYFVIRSANSKRTRRKYLIFRKQNVFFVSKLQF
jgi:hypothetical protein